MLIITCRYLSLLVVTHHCSKLLIIFSSLLIIVHHCSSLFITAHHYSSLFIITRHLSSLLIIVQHYSLIGHYYVALLIITRHYSSLLGITHHCSSFSMGICLCISSGVAQKHHKHSDAQTILGILCAFSVSNCNMITCPTTAVHGEM